ncbi:MAG: glycosyltransferase [Xenococcaceae cyanobacterium MO_188.B29]|nr:glycosyltransferase [Xenococcaceae cyanobacterium MO_188.B29]
MVLQKERLAIFRRDLMGGGAERVLINLASCFTANGLEVDLVLSRAEGPLLESVSSQVRIIDLKASAYDKGKRFRLPTSFSSLSSLPKLVNYLRQEKPKALLAASHYSNEIAILAKFLARVPTKIVISEHIALSVQAKQVEQISSRFAPITARLLYRLADGIIAVSEGVAKDLAQITKIPLERIQVIYNPVITPELLAKAQESIEHPWFAPGEPPVILGVGRLVKQKDFSTLIKAFAQVQAINPSRLVILGSGREQKALQSLIKELALEDKVALLGFVNNPSAYMAKASVFVLSSLWEGLPTVLIESMAVGTPIVSTDCESGPREILDCGQYGYLVPVGDQQAIADAIVKVLSGQSQSLDSNWLEQFKLESVTKKYMNILQV